MDKIKKICRRKLQVLSFLVVEVMFLCTIKAKIDLFIYPLKFSLIITFAINGFLKHLEQ